MSENELDIDEHLAALEKKKDDLGEQCYYRSAARVAMEIRRTARAEKRLIYYINATFTLMNQSHSLLEPETGRDAAIEMIGLLEHSERARAIQPDISEAEYNAKVEWLSSCSYDNLAKTVAEINGYNSDGMHACIADGIHVCRRTGKLQCITCFREYAGDVYRAADDLEMAMHFARGGIANENPGPHDRRWMSAKDLAELYMDSGRFEEAAQTIDRAWELVDTWHSVLDARYTTALKMNELACLLSEPDRWKAKIASSGVLNDQLPPGEAPTFELGQARIKSLIACCSGRHEEAIETLKIWDQKLLRNHCLANWFAIRLRLLAMYRMAGKTDEFVRLALQLETKARAARDWFTLRALQYMRDDNTVPVPFPVIAEPNAGIFARKKTGATPTTTPEAINTTTSEMSAGVPVSTTLDGNASDDDEGATETDETAENASPGPPEEVASIWQRIAAAQADCEDEASFNETMHQILADMLAIDPANERPASEASWLIHTIRFANHDGSRRSEIWGWANQVSIPFPQDAVVRNLLATLAWSLEPDEPKDEPPLVSDEAIEKMFRESLDLNSENARNFGRAGDYYYSRQNIGEAERCFARSNRLRRDDADIAKKLAQIYRQTDRARDALAVMDMAIREGSDDPELTWQTAVLAFEIGRHEAAITYLDAYEQLVPDEPWTNYYRAGSLIALKRYSEAMAATDIEESRNPDCPFPVMVHRALAHSGLEHHDEFRAHLENILAMRLADIDYLTPNGLCSLVRLLWNSVEAALDPADDLRRRLIDRSVASNLAPNELFKSVRANDEPSEGVNFYACELHQPLDARWADWHGRLAHEADWEGYTITWGVLAHSEEEAQAIVIKWQQQSFPLLPTVKEIRQDGEGYRDTTGVVWQSLREMA